MTKSFEYLLLLLLVFIIASCTEDNENYPPVTAEIQLLDDVNRHAGKNITFFAVTENATDIEWDFGDGTISADSAVIHSFVDKGNYLIRLRAWNNGNEQSVQLSIDVKDSIETLLTNRAVKSWVFYDMDPLICTCNHTITFNRNGGVTWTYEDSYWAGLSCDEVSGGCEISTRNQLYQVYRSDFPVTSGIYSAGHGILIGNSVGSGGGYEVEVTESDLSLKRGEITFYYQAE